MVGAEFPRTALDFEEQFATEDACVAYLRARRWPGGFVCPKCAGTASWPVRERLDECTACGRQTSITAGTVFHGTRKPPRVWFRAIAMMLVSKQGCSAKELERLFGLAHETAWTWTHKLRRLMAAPKDAKLDGRVEVDETYLGGEDDAAHKGRSVAGKKVCVVAAVEDHGKTMGRARIALIADATAKSLGVFVEENVAKGARLHTDGLPSYESVAKRGYVHEREVVGAPKSAARKFPHVHRIFSLARRVLLATHQGSVRPKHLQAYLDEFVFRFNRRTSTNRYMLVERLLGRVFCATTTYGQIVGKVGAP